MSQQASEQTYKHYIGGEWTEGHGDETFESVNPANQESLGTFHRGTPEDVDDELAAAEEAEDEWRQLS